MGRHVFAETEREDLPGLGPAPIHRDALESQAPPFQIGPGDVLPARAPWEVDGLGDGIVYVTLEDLLDPEDASKGDASVGIDRSTLIIATESQPGAFVGALAPRLRRRYPEGNRKTRRNLVNRRGSAMALALLPAGARRGSNNGTQAGSPGDRRER